LRDGHPVIPIDKEQRLILKTEHGDRRELVQQLCVALHAVEVEMSPGINQGVAE
jgi:hypothetical protein